jgi:hypothetical protein
MPESDSSISSIAGPASPVRLTPASFSRATSRRLRSIENHWPMLCAIVGPTPSIAVSASAPA